MDDKVKKYKQALIKIKEILNEPCYDIESCEECAYVLNIIAEVLDNDR